MPYTATVYKVMIASPSDVPKERALIREIINEWNSIHSKDKKIVLMPIGWESHASPAFGRPQEIINQQVLHDADLLVALFWNRIGSPTGKAQSGTIEEINEHLRAGKQVMIYVSNAKVNRHELDLKQAEALDKYLKGIRPKALVETYESTSKLRKKFTSQLAHTILRYFDNNGSSLETKSSSIPISIDSAPLSDIAQILLLKIAKDPKGQVMRTRSFDGLSVTTHGQELVDRGNPRDEARWQSAIEELITNNLISDRGSKGEIFAITSKGFQLIDNLKKSTNLEEFEPITVSETNKKKRQLLEKKPKSPFHYLDLFRKICIQNFPKAYKSTFYSNSKERIDKIFNELITNEANFHESLYINNGFISSELTIKRSSFGSLEINGIDTTISEIWVYFDDREFADYIIYHCIPSKPVYINNEYYFDTALIDNKHTIPVGEIHNNHAEIDGIVIDLSEHQVEITRRNNENAYHIIATEYHCVMQEKSLTFIRDLFKVLVTHNKPAPPVFNLFRAKISYHKHPEVLKTL
ncbi:hypothetical protein LX87_05209 [Larkinella arboricola]|uniref:DUF4062 domain-containing protein n=1 Tax=Larkinella arboricola TaxID=643671 RepID=A0A327WLI9_LARAB|nr:hypothetical protein [Larkinella arboricola]RAJ92241.1 hypothetical protein LX87_05209 [Larkinella arboricola]